MKSYRALVAICLFILMVGGCAVHPAQTVAPTKAVTAPAPTFTPVAATTAQPEPTATTTTGFSFNEENFLQYFQFGMTSDKVKSVLDSLHINYSKTTDTSDDNVPVGSWALSNDQMSFDFDSNNQLYSIDFNNIVTAKGLEYGDTVEKIHQLYGKEDELYLPGTYIYNRDGYHLSINVDTGNANNNGVNGWSISVDIFNFPDIFKNGYNSGSVKNLTGDARIQFNENNFQKYFKFGMSKKQIEKKLTDLGIRITQETADLELDSKYYTINTDHIQFIIEYYSGRLVEIDVTGLETAKGLKEGDSLKRLHQLYGKEYRYDSSNSSYAYKKDGYYFTVYFIDDDPSTVSFWLLEEK